MEDRVITTHMSLKQALKKNKEVTKSLSQVNNNRSQILSLGVNNLKDDQLLGSDSDESVNQPVIKTYADVPVLDFMKDKMLAILGSYSQTMKDTIEMNTNGYKYGDEKSQYDKASVSKKIEAIKQKKLRDKQLSVTKE